MEGVTSLVYSDDFTSRRIRGCLKADYLGQTAPKHNKQHADPLAELPPTKPKSTSRLRHTFCSEAAAATTYFAL
jgi:hypothetical protein